MLSNSESKKFSKWTSVNSKIFKMYRDSFNRVIPGSLKEIEFQSFRRTEKLSTYKSSPVPGKSLKLTEFSKNHVNLASGTKIIELPMSPFGKHTSYNNETEFKSKHFLNSTSTENRALEKQIKLLRKRINSNLKNSVVKKGYFRANQFMNVFKTNGGSLYSSVIKERYLKTERSVSEEDRKSTSMNSSTVKDLRSFGKISPIRELRECN
jgi:hypothetical protein